MRLVDRTRDAACLYKPNIAFYEARGLAGLAALRQTMVHIRDSGVPVLLDAKRGDISTSAAAYARAVFDEWGADAVTVNPLLGSDGIEPFIARPDRGAFVLCHTTNPGARDLQELDTGGVPLYDRIARLAAGWNTRGNVGLVIGATFPEVLDRVRRVLPDMWFLLPGIGAQGGDLEASLTAALTASGAGVLVNVSRGISGAADPRAAAIEYRDRINDIRGRRASRSGSAAAPTPAAAPLKRQIALGLHALGAVRFGEFTLKSGLRSPIYVDLRLLVGDPRLMALVARAVSGMLSGLHFDRIAAIPYGGLPIGQAVSLETGKPLLYPRREVKDHGTRNAIEGAFSAGETVVMLDDLVTTGGSKLEAAEPLLAAGLVIRDVAVLVDREQGGSRELAEKGYCLHAVLTLSEILDILAEEGRIAPAVRDDVRQALGIA
jgi:uridine monophosphate synthetase